MAAPAGLVAPGGRVVVGQSADAATNGGAPVSVGYGTRLMLNNGGEEVSLCLGPCAEGVVLDRVTWGDLGAAYDGHALVLDRSAGLLCRRSSHSVLPAISARRASPTAVARHQTADSEANSGGAAAPPDDIRFPDP